MTQLFLQQTGVEVPVICGPMYPGSNPELVAAVSAAGGLGVMQPISMTHIYGHDFRKGLQLIKQLTDKPFGMNFTLLAGNKRYEKRLEEWMSISIEEGVKFFLTSLGDPKWVCKKAHEHGIVVYHDVTTGYFAQKAQDAGVDGLICVNNRAGGQTGAKSPEAMMEEMKSISIPLVCAGGIGNEDDFISALKMGYAAVQMGTRFLATKECQVQEEYKQAIVQSQEKDIVWTNKLAGTNSSVIRTKDIEKGGLMVNPFFGYLLKNNSTKKLMRTLLLLRSLQTHKKVVLEKGYGQIWQAGKSVGSIQEVLAAGAVVDTFRKAYQEYSSKA
jgi:nitronate monooxygenase